MNVMRSPSSRPPPASLTAGGLEIGARSISAKPACTINTIAIARMRVGRTPKSLENGAGDFMAGIIWPSSRNEYTE